MTEQELIEVWRKEFESLRMAEGIPIDIFERDFVSGIYHDAAEEYFWNGFLMAKRSQPVVVLPKVDYGLHIMDSAEQQTYQERVEHALTAAGIEFEVEK